MHGRGCRCRFTAVVVAHGRIRAIVQVLRSKQVTAGRTQVDCVV